jgi:hypothetical protein
MWSEPLLTDAFNLKGTIMSHFPIHTLDSAPEQSKPAMNGLAQAFGMAYIDSNEEGTHIMPSLIKSALISGMLSIPLFAFGQTLPAPADNVPLTRGEIRADLVRVEQAGYRPDQVHYPANIQAAQAKIAASNDAGGVGGVAVASSAAGEVVVGSTAPQRLFGHH